MPNSHQYGTMTENLNDSPIISKCDELENSAESLLQVADYCQNSYNMPAPIVPLTGIATIDRRAKRGAAAACIQNKRRQTLSFAIQSVASVAYDISQLAGSMNTMIDQVEKSISDLEDYAKRVQAKAAILYERTCRRCIGTISLPVIQVEYPKTDPKPIREIKPVGHYSRKPLDFTSLAVAVFS
ncbi:hypothetical protein ACOME3_004530 [Neoechinorhynchus agilis]